MAWARVVIEAFQRFDFHRVQAAGQFVEAFGYLTGFAQFLLTFMFALPIFIVMGIGLAREACGADRER